MNTLSSLVERDETPEQDIRPNLNSILSSPTTAMTPAKGHHVLGTNTDTLKTPNTAARLYPSLDEMHPSKVQQSTTKQPDPGLPLGFVDIASPRTATGRSKKTIGVTEDTPTKVRTSHHKDTSEFEFKFARRTPLGPEAQKMMEDLREEALKIKEKMTVEQIEEDGSVGGQQGVISGRKIAQPKGKAGRFSDVHRAEFKKMDSIAAHPSAFRAQTGTSSQELPNTPGIKRTKSQARLDEVEQEATATRNDLPGPSNTGKRVKISAQDDTSSMRPTSRDGKASVGATSPAKPTVIGHHPTPGLPAAASTPTKASLARSASVKNIRATPATSAIPRSKSAHNLLMSGARSEGRPKHRPHHHALSSLGKVKSILRRPQIFKNHEEEDHQDQQHPSSAAGGDVIAGISKDLPPVPEVSSPLVGNKSVGKHVTFTNIARDGTSTSPSYSPVTTPGRAASIAMSPSVMASVKANKNRTPMVTVNNEPMTSSSPVMISTADAVQLSQQSPSRSTLSSPVMIRYPSLPVPGSAAAAGKTGQMPRAGNFTFSAGKAIKFGDVSGMNTSINGTATGDQNRASGRPTSAGSMGSMTGGSTIRHVRPSTINDNSMASLTASAAKRLGPGTHHLLDKQPLHLTRSPISSVQYPAIPHGMSNKKRHRSDLDDEDDHYLSVRGGHQHPQLHSPNRTGGNTHITTMGAAETEEKGKDDDNMSDQENRDPKRIKRHHHTTGNNEHENQKEKATGSMFKSSPSKFRIMTTRSASSSPPKKMNRLMFTKSPTKMGGSSMVGSNKGRGFGGMGMGTGMNVLKKNGDAADGALGGSKIPSPVKKSTSSTMGMAMGGAMGKESSTGDGNGNGNGNPSGKKPVGMLSLSRLNALARPKSRG